MDLPYFRPESGGLFPAVLRSTSYLLLARRWDVEELKSASYVKRFRAPQSWRGRTPPKVEPTQGAGSANTVI